MKNVYTAFKFGNYESKSDDILNVTLNNDMYNENIRGSRNIIEEKVQGVEAPYFFYVDDETLQFAVNFAFEGKSKAEIKGMTRALITAEAYTPLSFGDIINNVYIRKTPIYNVIFIGEPQLSFIGRSVDGALKYDGYFTLQARCDRPYGFEVVSVTPFTNAAGLAHVSIADINLVPNITITSTTVVNNFALKNRKQTNPIGFDGEVLSQITFSQIRANETITINGNLFTISSNNSNFDIYSRWGRNTFKLQPGVNYITAEATGTVTVTISYEAPVLIMAEQE
jgi:hypothetical protein